VPELPEVETIRRGLLALRKQRIKDVVIHLPKIIRPADAGRRLTGQTVRLIDRRGKLLIFSLASGDYLLIHLKMTGQLVYRPKPGKMFVGGHPIVNVLDVPNKFTHVELHFQDKGVLYFNDVRRFGYLKLTDEAELTKIKAGYGPEPLDLKLTSQQWLKILEKKSHWSVKKLLLDQSQIAGIGNIYCDEACFYTGIRPMRLVGSLKPSEKVALLKNIRKVLNLSIKYGGTSFNSYVQSQGHQWKFYDLLKVYGRGGQLCKKCKKTSIMKIKFAGRGTHYCPRCQK
jgi:formamidopyrimidine-DNA glycosylase